MKIKLVEPGYENLTGELGPFMLFENGISVSDLTLAQVSRLGAVMRIVNVDTEEQVGSTADSVNVRAAEHPVGSEVIVENEVGTTSEMPAAAESPPYADYEFSSRESLEALVDAKGIKGLREVGEKLGVKGKSVPDLIDAILKAEFKIRKQLDYVGTTSGHEE